MGGLRRETCMRMGRLLRFGTVLLLALVSTQAEAGPRISLAMRGDRRSVLSTQLAMELCGTYECVLRAKVFTGPKADFQKARRLGVKGILVGAVSRKRGERVVSLALLTRPGRPAQRWRFPLTAQGTLAPDSLDQLMKDLEVRLGGPPPRASAPVAATPPIPQPALPSPAAPAPLPEEKPAAPLAEAPTPPPEPPPATSPEPTAPVANLPAPSPEARDAGPRKEKKRQWLMAAEVGYFGTKRDLSYEGTTPGGTNNLRTYSASFISSPCLYLELFPFSQVTDGAFAGLGLFADYSFSVGLKTDVKDSVTGTVLSQNNTSFTRAQAGLEWRIYPISSSRFAIVPAVSWQLMKFNVDPPISGLPGTNLRGVKGALGLEIPAGDSFSLLLGGGYVKWVVAKDLIEGGFFPGGSAYALEAEAGFSLTLFGPVSLRMLFEYSSTKYSLNPDPTGTYIATGAKDEYIGGRGMLRWEL
jgi:hypothetical protein